MAIIITDADRVAAIEQDPDLQRVWQRASPSWPKQPFINVFRDMIDGLICLDEAERAARHG